MTRPPKPPEAETKRSGTTWLNPWNRAFLRRYTEPPDRDNLEREVPRMVRNYDGSAQRATELLETLVIARESGVPACERIELELTQRARNRADPLRWTI